MPSSPFAFNLSQHRGLFKWISSSHRWPKILELQLQHQSFQWIFRVDFLTGLISLLSKRLKSLRVFHSSTIQKHQLFSAQPSLWPNSHICTWLLENHSFDYMDLCWHRSLLSNALSRLVTAFLPRNIQGWCPFLDWFDFLAVQGTQESSPAAQFESIDSSVLSFLYGPILTSLHVYWKKP